MKQHNKLARLNGKIKDYNDMVAHEGRYKQGKSIDNPDGYHKPGSFKKS